MFGAVNLVILFDVINLVSLTDLVESSGECSKKKLVENLGESQVNSPLEKKNSPLKNLYSGRYVLYSWPKIYLLFTLPVPSTVLKF